MSIKCSILYSEKKTVKCSCHQAARKKEKKKMTKRYSDRAPETYLNFLTLKFYLNFILNHNKFIYDNDTFDTLTETFLADNIVERIKNDFSPTMLKRLQQRSRKGDRLDFGDHVTEIIREVWADEKARKKLKELIAEEINARLATFDEDAFAQEGFYSRCQECKELFELSEPEYTILLAIYISEKNRLRNDSGHNETEQTTFIAKYTDLDIGMVEKAIGSKSKLRRYGCIKGNDEVTEDIKNFLLGSSIGLLSDSFYKKFDGETLPLEYFPEKIRQHGKMIERIISATAGKRSANILFYGAPGTGKSSFAHAIASGMNKRLYCITQQVKVRENCVASTPEFRFGALSICQDQIDHENSIILVDEADSMLNVYGDNSSRGDKGRLNAVLDDATVPVIWITNSDADELDESSRRRFDYSVCFKPLNTSQRMNIWNNNIQKLNISGLFTEQDVRSFASRYQVSAGIVTQVLKNIKGINSTAETSKEDVEMLMRSHCELLRMQEEHGRYMPVSNYSLDGLNIRGDMKLESIVEAVRNFQREGIRKKKDAPQMNLLLSGPPGTGKSEFVKYLGSVLDTKVAVKMGSDILSKWVGETEENIRNTFENASEENSIIFLDELDGLMQSRNRAGHSWEVTQVNELLFQMENFNGIMIGATNFSSNLDPAVLRRFTFKINFDYLDDRGKKLFFERIFDTTLTESEERRLCAIDMLAPGDFKVVRQKLYYLDNGQDNAVRLDALESECAEKKRNIFAERPRMGF